MMRPFYGTTTFVLVVAGLVIAWKAAPKGVKDAIRKLMPEGVKKALDWISGLTWGKVFAFLAITAALVLSGGWLLALVGGWVGAGGTALAIVKAVGALAGLAGSGYISSQVLGTTPAGKGGDLSINVPGSAANPSTP